MSDQIEVNFLRDLVSYLREQAVQAARRSAETGSEFDSGSEFGFRQALARIRNQAEGFNICLEDIGLDESDPMHGPLE